MASSVRLPMRPIELSQREADRFWAKVEKLGTDECWPWKACHDKDGYAIFPVTRSRRFQASRVSYALAHGRQPDGFVCHACDNPGCVNPDHLWVGDHLDNMRDMIHKGRHPKLGVTHCHRGHEYTAENTVYRRDRARPCRMCRECRRLASAAYIARKSGAAA